MKKLFTKQTALIGFIFLAAFAISQASQAYLSVNETAELLPEGYSKFGFAPQLRVSDGGGLNVSAHFDTYVTDNFNGRFEIGGGKTDFWTQASLKWVPFPDIERQPAMGVRTAVIYSRDENIDFYNVQVAPMLSKVADTRYGKMIPFIALPITFINTRDFSETASQFTVGAEWFSNRDMHIGAEIDLNLSKTFTSISTFISFPFDSAIGYKK